VFSVDTSGGDAIQVAVQRTWINTSVESSDLDLSVVDAASLLRDPAAPDGWRLVPPRDAGGELFFAPPISDEPPVLAIRVPGESDPALWRLWTIPGHRALRFESTRFGRPGSQIAPPTARLDFLVDLDSPYVVGDSLETYTIGSWTVRSFTGGELPGEGALLWDPPSYPFVSSSPRANVYVDRIDGDDAVLIVRRRAGDLVGHMVAPPFDMIDGDNIIVGAMTPSLGAVGFTVAFNAAAIRARVQQVVTMPLSFASQYATSSAPGHGVGQSLGPILSQHAIDDDAVSVTGPLVDLFADRGWPLTVSFTSNGYSTFEPGILLYAGFALLASPADLPAAVDYEPGLPTMLTINGAMLTDVTELGIAHGPVLEIDVAFDRGGCEVYELVLAALDRRTYVRHISTLPHFVVPQDYLPKDDPIFVRAYCIDGLYPNVVDGDVATRAFPMSFGYRDMGVIRLIPPSAAM
jgi:hypothetical protein